MRLPRSQSALALALSTLLAFGVGSLATVASSPAVAAPDDGGDDPAEGVKETPEAERKRKRLELDERRDKLPDSAKPALALLDEFRDRDFRVWSSLRDRLVAMGPDAVPATVLTLEELDWETRAFAASCLARLGDRSAAGALIDAYERESYTEGKRQVLLALVALGAESAKDLYLEAAKSDDPGLRIAAVRGLGSLKDASLVDVLRPFSEQKDDLDVRYEALGSLLELDDEAARETLLSEARALVADRKLERVDSPVKQDNGDRYSQYLLGQALARGGGKEIDDILFKALLAEAPYDHKDFLRMGAAEGLGRRAAREGEVHPKLASGITDKDAKVRAACTFAAGWIGSEELTSSLIKNLGDTQLDVRHNCVVALGRIGSEDALKGLKKAIKDRDGEIRISAVRALGDILHPDATDALIKLARDDKYMIRVMAVRRLALRTTEAGVLKALERAARDKDYGVRAQALAALAHHPDGSQVVDAIVGGLDDKDFGVEANAMLGLAAIADTTDFAQHEKAISKAVDLYVSANEDRLYKAGKEFLDAARPPQAVEPLFGYLDDKSQTVRERAHLALMMMGDVSINYRPDGSPRDWDEGIKRWQEWWAKQDGKLPKRGERPRAAVTGSLVDVARDLKWKGLDIALLFDSTGSMAGLIRAAKQRLDEMIDELGLLLPSLRVSVYTYRDFGDDFVYWGTPLTYDTWTLSGFMQNATHGQGGDIPEAVYDCTKNAMDNLKWRPEAHKVIVYAGDAPHHPEQDEMFMEAIHEFCKPYSNATLHALFTDTERRSLDIAARKKRPDASDSNHPFFQIYKRTAEAGRGQAVMLDDESALIKELLVLTFGEAWRADIENMLDFEY